MTEPEPGRPALRAKLPHDAPSWVRDDSVFFITICCTPRGTNHLCNQAMTGILFESVRFRQYRGDWYAHLMLLMPDHLHALISFPHDRVMKSVISNWKEFMAKKAGVSWQRDFFDHRIRNDEGLEGKAR